MALSNRIVAVARDLGTFADVSRSQPRDGCGKRAEPSGFCVMKGKGHDEQ